MGPQQQQQQQQQQSQSETATVSTTAGESATSADQSSSNGVTENQAQLPLYLKYPVLSVWEFVLAPNNTQVSGTVYSTDVTSQTIMMLPVTAVESLMQHQQQQQQQQQSGSSSNGAALGTTATEIRIVNATCIRKATQLKAAPDNQDNDNDDDDGSTAIPISLNITTPIAKKTLEDRERRAIRQAEESFRHMNDKASSEGQDVFDRLLKACGQVTWNNETIIVLDSVRVDPPYLPENCQMLLVQQNSSNSNNNSKSSNSSQEALERVQKIVASVDRSKK